MVVNKLRNRFRKCIIIFKCEKEAIYRIVVKIDKEIDLFTEEGYTWLLQNPNDPSIDYLKGSKQYTSDRNKELFDLIEKGSQIARGELFEYFNRLTS